MNSEKECNGDIEKSGCNGAFLEKRKDCQLELTWRHALKQVSDKSFSLSFSFLEPCQNVVDFVMKELDEKSI